VIGALVSAVDDSSYLTLISLARLHLPGEIVPATHKKVVRPARPAPTRGPQRDGEGGGYKPRDREGYRGKDTAPEGFRPQYAGVGRGGPREE
jgi:small subunit ribosomal protein S10e